MSKGLPTFVVWDCVHVAGQFQASKSLCGGYKLGEV